MSQAINGAETFLAIKSGKFKTSCGESESEWVLAILDLSEILLSGLATLLLREKDASDRVSDGMEIYILLLSSPTPPLFVFNCEQDLH